MVKESPGLLAPLGLLWPLASLPGLPNPWFGPPRPALWRGSGSRGHPHRRGMLGLVDLHFAAAGQLERRHKAPAHIGDWPGEFDSLPYEVFNSSFDVVAHQMQSADQFSFGGMYAQFCRRQGKNQPAMPSVYIREFEGIAEESTEAVRIFRVNDCMESIDHFRFTSDDKS
jgi:hypothetical protein